MQLILAVIGMIYLLTGILYFSRRKPGYSQVRHTISELGEKGAPDAKKVAWALFFPVGILFFFIGWLAQDNVLIQGLAGCIGFGYSISAIFPCDKGSPINGSLSQHIHNFGGAVLYIGSIYFIRQASDQTLPISLNLISIVLVICAILLSIPKSGFRGLVQRFTEAMLLGILIYEIAYFQ